MRQFLTVLLMAALIPYVTTLAWTGRGSGQNAAGMFSGAPDDMWGGMSDGLSDGTSGGRSDGSRDGAGQRAVFFERNGREFFVSVEEFLIGVLAAQIPAEYGKETIKAQAVLARTYIYREMDGDDEIPEEALDMDVLTRDQMETLWGDGSFAENYEKLRSAVNATAGEILLYEGEPIEPFFCRAAAGRTRSRGEDYPYLWQAESPGDLEAEGFLQTASFTERELADRLNQIPGAVRVTAPGILEQIQIVERDGAGYVRQIQAGAKTYTGEEIQYALGLPSACYSFEAVGDKIRAVSKGIGHGYGFSQAGANAMERDGYDYRALLTYYFQNIEIANR